MNSIKHLILFLYWTPRIWKAAWRQINGNFFVLRDEPNAFLRYLQWYFHGIDLSVHADSLPQSLLLQQELDAEIAARMRRGDWPYAI